MTFYGCVFVDSSSWVRLCGSFVFVWMCAPLFAGLTYDGFGLKNSVGEAYEQVEQTKRKRPIVVKLTRFLCWRGAEQRFLRFFVQLNMISALLPVWLQS